MALASTPVDQASDLDDWRQRGDPLADAAVAALGDDARPGLDLWTLVCERANDDSRLHDLVQSVRSVQADYVAGEIEAGRQMALAHAPHCFLALLLAALVESFAHAGGAAVLSATGRLERDGKRRVYETASLVRDALLPGGLSLDSDLGQGRAAGGQDFAGKGAVDLLRVRLLHAAVRRWLKGQGFDAAAHGTPINQADMLHTLLLFDRVLLRGIRGLGGQISEEEDRSWSALWRHAGRLLGVADQLLPNSAHEATERYEQITAALIPSEKSVRLTAAILDAFKFEAPFFLPRGGLAAASYDLVHPCLREALGLKPGAIGWRSSLVLARGVAAGVAQAGSSTWTRPTAVKIGSVFVEANRTRVLRWMEEADYGFRTN